MELAAAAERRTALEAEKAEQGREEVEHVRPSHPKEGEAC